MKNFGLALLMAILTFSTLACQKKSNSNSGADSDAGIRQVKIGEFSWTLMKVTSEGWQVWKDDSTGKLWSDSDTTKVFTHFETGSFCRSCNGQSPVEIACISESTLPMRGNLKDLNWALASRAEWTTAMSHGAQKVLRSNGSWTWTSDLSICNADAYFVEANGNFSSDNCGRSYPIRCVTR